MIQTPGRSTYISCRLSCRIVIFLPQRDQAAVKIAQSVVEGFVESLKRIAQFRDIINPFSVHFCQDTAGTVLVHLSHIGSVLVFQILLFLFVKPHVAQISSCLLAVLCFYVVKIHQEFFFEIFFFSLIFLIGKDFFLLHKLQRLIEEISDGIRVNKFALLVSQMGFHLIRTFILGYRVIFRAENRIGNGSSCVFAAFYYHVFIFFHSGKRVLQFFYSFFLSDLNIIDLVHGFFFLRIQI